MSDIRPPLTWLQLESLVPLETKAGVTSVKTITTLSADTLEREYGEYVIRLSPGRRAMKLRNALKIAGTVIADTDTAA